MMKKSAFYFALFLVMLFSCEKEDYEIVNLNNNSITILGHGGMGVGRAQYPLDSYESLVKAISMGADGSEMDIQITKDSVLVCYHDTYLEEMTDGTGEIYALNWDVVKKAVFRTVPYTHYSIASLDERFSYNSGGGHFFTFDIKFKNPDQSEKNRDIFQRALIRFIEKYHLEKNSTIESPDSMFLKSLQMKKSDLNLFYYTGFEDAYNTAKYNGFKGITVKGSEVTSEQVLKAHEAGLQVAVFSATRMNHDEIIRKNVDIIQTDDLQDLLDRLR